jgi:hypothetical protein
MQTPELNTCRIQIQLYRHSVSYLIEAGDLVEAGTAVKQHRRASWDRHGSSSETFGTFYLAPARVNVAESLFQVLKSSPATRTQMLR